MLCRKPAQAFYKFREMARLREVLTCLSCAAAAAILIAGCASVPQASPERDADAKQFNTQPNAATIYVYRPDLQDLSDVDTVLWVDNRLIGGTLPRTFFRLNLRPGRHRLGSEAGDIGRLEIDTNTGELYFVSLRVVGGSSNFQLVPPETGKRDILRCCAMLENWAPGQRPVPR